ncbi:MAG: PAS domain-containing protein [Alphaproteobacteria bacterium]
MKTDLEPVLLESPGAKTLYRCWQQARGIRVMPSRADLDAADLRAVSAYVQLYEVVDGGRRFYTRAAGSAAAAALGYDPTGQFVDELPAGTGRRRTLKALREVVRTGVPAFDQYPAAGLEQSTSTGPAHEDIMLPLSRDGSGVQMVLFASFSLAAR